MSANREVGHRASRQGTDTIQLPFLQSICPGTPMDLIFTILIVFALYALLIAVRTGFSEVVTALQAIYDKLDEQAKP